MLKRLTLERFKGFEKAELNLGPLTLLVGTNASGKSNLRDAFRFLHGISRGYTLAEIIGEKWIEGVLQWRGIRGGTREATFNQAKTFSLDAVFQTQEYGDGKYHIEVDVGENSQPPRVVGEWLSFPDKKHTVFHSHPYRFPLDPYSSNRIGIAVPEYDHDGNDVGYQVKSYSNDKPVLLQIDQPRNYLQAAYKAFISMRFLDFLSPDAMRNPSLPGQTSLGDKGEYLSSVLQAICNDPARKKALINWLQELTPMDAKDFEFPADQTGKILLSLVEENGQKTSAYSASDGTLRFLAMIALLLGPDPAKFYFFEELENGIHPTRSHLLLQLIEKKVSEGNIQIVATTHSPHLLGQLSQKSLEYVSFTYRLPGKPNAQIKRLMDIPEAAKILQEQDITRLHASGWLEDAVAFLDEDKTLE